MRTNLLLLLLACAVALAAQSVKLNNGTVEVTGDISQPALATNLFPLISGSTLPPKLPRLAWAQLVTNHISTVKFNAGIVSVTNSTDTNAIWFIYFDAGTTNGLIPLTNGVIKP